MNYQEYYSTLNAQQLEAEFTQVMNSNKSDSNTASRMLALTEARMQLQQITPPTPEQVAAAAKERSDAAKQTVLDDFHSKIEAAKAAGDTAHAERLSMGLAASIKDRDAEMAKMAVMQERTKAQWAEESAIDAKIREATEAAQDLAPNSEGYEAAFHTLNALKTQKSDMQKASVVALSAPPTAEELAAVQSTAASM